MKEKIGSMIDSHAHLHDQRFDNDRDSVVVRAKENGTTFIVTVGTNVETSRQAISCAETYDMVYATVGMHPLHSFEAYACDPEDQHVEDFDYDVYKKLAQHHKVVAIGEVGLDYHHFGPHYDVEKIKNKQREIFTRFIDLCNDVHKPIVVHCWDGYDDLVEILARNVVEKKGIVHSYVGSWKRAIALVELGYMIGVNGIVTYGDSYDTLIRKIGLDHLVIETDCPYLSPRPLPRDGRCEPKDVFYVAQKIAAVTGITVDEVLQKTECNAKKVFGI